MLLTGGVYIGPVVVDKPLRFTCAGECAIDANCEAPIAFDIQADRVLVRSGSKSGAIFFYRGSHTQIRIADRTKVTLRGRITTSKVQFNSCGTEQNGIEVSGASTKVQLIDVGAYTLPGAGLLLSGLAPRAGVKIADFFAIGNAAAISLENSAVGSKRGGSGIFVDNSTLIDNGIGIRVIGSDGLRVKRATVVQNTDVFGSIGIMLDASSNRALVMRSEWDDRSASGTSFVDAGTGTCGVANQGFLIPSCP